MLPSRPTLLPFIDSHFILKMCSLYLHFVAFWLRNRSLTSYGWAFCLQPYSDLWLRLLNHYPFKVVCMNNWIKLELAGFRSETGTAHIEIDVGNTRARQKGYHQWSTVQASLAICIIIQCADGLPICIPISIQYPHKRFLSAHMRIVRMHTWGTHIPILYSMYNKNQLYQQQKYFQLLKNRFLFILLPLPLLFDVFLYRFRLSSLSSNPFCYILHIRASTMLSFCIKHWHGSDGCAIVQ